jgi:dienelactone hydrolase
MRLTTRALFGRLLAILALATVTAVGLVVGPAATPAATNPFERGPAPTLASIQASTGPFSVATATVAKGNGFGGGTIYYPTDTSQGTFAAIAVVPGFTEKQSAISWYGPRIASQGFVLFTIDTNSTSDNPASRGTQLLAALDYLTQQSPVKSRIDPNRLGVMGHSMGGGGTLEASKTRPSLKAAIGLAPWDQTKNWSTNKVPTMLIGAQNDTIAPPSSFAIPFYNSLPASLQKVYVEIAGASHFTFNNPNTSIAQYSIAFLKRELDNDTRYSQFLCPAPTTGGSSPISKYISTCPF